MRARRQELERRHALLVRRSADERDALLGLLGSAARVADRIDPALVTAGRWVRGPVGILAAATIVVLVARRAHPARIVGAAMALLSAGSPIWRFVARWAVRRRRRRLQWMPSEGR